MVDARMGFSGSTSCGMGGGGSPASCVRYWASSCIRRLVKPALTSIFPVAGSLYLFHIENARAAPGKSPWLWHFITVDCCIPAIPTLNENDTRLSNWHCVHAL